MEWKGKRQEAGTPGKRSLHWFKGEMVRSLPVDRELEMWSKRGIWEKI